MPEQVGAQRAATDPYLTGNYRPIHTEITTNLEVTHGQLPDDLAGTFVRIGSNPRFAPQGRYHWFDGDGMIHAVRFCGGRAEYRNRWVRTDAFRAEEEAGECLWTGIREPPDFTRPEGPFKDNANTDLIWHGGKLLALWWLGGVPYRIRLPDLETLGQERFDGKLPGGLSAHPKLDPRTGEMVVFDYKPFPPYLSHGVIAADGSLTHWTTVDLPGPRSQHDLAITERFSILMDMSMFPDMTRGGRTVFDRNKPTRFGILPRHAEGSEIRWFETSPCFMYHTINAWEDGNRVVIVGCRIGDPLDRDPDHPARPADERVPRIGFLRLEPCLWRWTLDLESGSVKEEQLDDVLAEFPRMNDLRLGVPTRYAYDQRIAPAPTLLFDGVIKYDTEAGRSTVHAYPDGWYGGETVFAPRDGGRTEPQSGEPSGAQRTGAEPRTEPQSGEPSGAQRTGAEPRTEDDGYLLTYVVEEATGESELHVLDATHVEAEPVARLRVPQRVPTGYHTWWVSAADLLRSS